MSHENQTPNNITPHEAPPIQAAFGGGEGGDSRLAAVEAAFGWPLAAHFQHLATIRGYSGHAIVYAEMVHKHYDNSDWFSVHRSFYCVQDIRLA